jgi:hypothetical protein
MTRVLATLLALALALVTEATRAERAPPRPVRMRVAFADATFVGKVTSLADKDIPADLAKGDGLMIRLASVVVTSRLTGGVGKNIEVGIIASRRFAASAVAKGDELLFFAHRHPTRKNTWIVYPYDGYIAMGPGGKAVVDEARSAAALIVDPMKALKSKDGGHRAAAAALLVHRYRTAPPFGPKTEAVPAAESKLILQALADGDWKSTPFWGAANPRTAFPLLALTDKDGWKPPSELEKFHEAARKWLRDNAGKYKMTRYARGDGPSEEPPPSSK